MSEFYFIKELKKQLIMGEITFDKELIKNRYPYPIATCFAKVQKEELLISKKKSTYQKLFLSMIDTFEITLRFLGGIVVKEYLDTGKTVEEFNELFLTNVTIQNPLNP